MTGRSRDLDKAVALDVPKRRTRWGRQINELGQQVLVRGDAILNWGQFIVGERNLLAQPEQIFPGFEHLRGRRFLGR